MKLSTVKKPSNVIYIKGASLAWPDLWLVLRMEKDKAGRWYPSDSTPKGVKEYLSDYRSPSRAWPLSYASALLRPKFAKWLCGADGELALKLGVGEV